MDKLQVYKKYFETAKDDTHLVMHRGYALALVEMVERYEKALKEIKDGSYKSDYYTGWSYDIAHKTLKD